jgi:putative DNA primase/helicase
MGNAASLGVGIVELHPSPPEVDSSEPLPCARKMLRAKFSHDDGFVLVFWQDTFMRWTGGAWRPMPVSELAARTYEYLDRVQLRPTRSKVVNVIDAVKAAAYLPHDVAPPTWIGDDRDVRHWLALKNGVLDLKTRVLTPPTPKFFTLSALPVAYDPDCGEPTQWLRFLDSIWPDDAHSVRTLQELAGYLVTPATEQQKIFMFVGPKRSGKGTILRTLGAMLGADNMCAPTLSSLAGNFGLQPLIGKLAAFVGDARLGGRADQAAITERLLSISGQDNVGIARKFLPDFTGRLDVRFVLSTNELPRLTDSSGALVSRIILLLLTKSFYGFEDLHLEARLRAELPAILNWAIDGWERLDERGCFEQPPAGQAAVDQLADLSSPIGAFVRSECTVGPGLSVGIDTLYAAWQGWCAQQGRDHVGTKQVFGRDLSAAYPGVRAVQRRANAARFRVYEGIALGTQ